MFFYLLSIISVILWFRILFFAPPLDPDTNKFTKTGTRDFILATILSIISIIGVIVISL